MNNSGSIKSITTEIRGYQTENEHSGATGVRIRFLQCHSPVFSHRTPGALHIMRIRACARVFKNKSKLQEKMDD